MSQLRDRLYELLPVIYKQHDELQGSPLKALLEVIAEQVNLVEANIDQLYENWFIETCEDWAIPYIADLIGYRPVNEAGKPGDIKTDQGQRLNRTLIPRQEVANTLRYRQRKGTLALLELLANDVASWSARVVEFYKLLGRTQHLNYQRPFQGQTVNLRNIDALDRINGAFDELAHTIDVRRIQSSRHRGKYNLPYVGLFIYRLNAYSVTQTPAYCLEEVGPHCYTFSVLGNDTPLYNHPQAEPGPNHIANELNLPIPIRRRCLENHIDNYYGEGKSLQIWIGSSQAQSPEMQLVPSDRIAVADLQNWQYRSPAGIITVDPVRGRMVFPIRQLPKAGVWVYYHYGFSADIGGGEYDRPLFQPAQHTLYRVGRHQEFSTINAALNQWNGQRQSLQGPQNQLSEDEQEKLKHAVIEIADSGVYTERFEIHLEEQCSLQIRAANYARPVIRLLDYQADTADSLRVYVQSGSQFTLDGVLVMGRGVQIQSEMPDFLSDSAESLKPQSKSVRINIRHSTLLPGWALHNNCDSKRPNEPSLELFNIEGEIKVSHSIIGSIQVNLDEVYTEPLPINVRDSIIDATSQNQVALDAVGLPVAHAKLTILRTTVLGRILTHSIELAENSIFKGKLQVARRQTGCIRFCYITPGSRTPRRYNCQPDLAEEPFVKKLNDLELNQNSSVVEKAKLESAKQRERDRVRPIFNSTQYSNPNYCQLANDCAEEIKRGSEEESEMGVFHNLYQPQRAENLRTRLNEYTPAEMETGIFYVN